MPECHNCEHNGKGHVACLRCKVPSAPSHHGRTHVSIHSGVDDSGQTLGEVEATLNSIPTADTPDDQPDALEAVRPLAVWLLSLAPRDRDVACCRIAAPGIPKLELARRIGTTIGCLMVSFRRIRAALPAGAGRGLTTIFTAEDEDLRARRLGRAGGLPSARTTSPHERDVSSAGATGPSPFAHPDEEGDLADADRDEADDDRDDEARDDDAGKDGLDEIGDCVRQDLDAFGSGDDDPDGIADRVRQELGAFGTGDDGDD